MGELLSMPTTGDVFDDVRGGDRTMRVTYHPERGVVVVSLWFDGICRASFRLAADDLPRLRQALSGCESDTAGQEPRDEPEAAAS